MTRPPIEKLKEWFEVTGRVRGMMGGGSAHKDIITICDYALELEAKVKRMEEALRTIANGRVDEWFCWPEIAEQALKEEKP